MSMHFSCVCGGDVRVCVSEIIQCLCKDGWNIPFSQYHHLPALDKPYYAKW